MSTVRVAGVTAAIGTAVVHSTVQVAEVGAAVLVAHSTVRVAGITVVAVASTPAGTARVAGITVSTFTPTTLQARAGADVAAGSYEDIVLDGSRSTGAYTTAVWEQEITGSEPEVIPDDGITVAIQAPPRPAAYTLTMRLTVSDGVSVSIDRTVITVRPWQFWVLSTANVWVARVRTAL